MVYSSSTDSVTTPGFTWTNDNNTGMYQPSANQVGITCDQQSVAVFKQGSLDVTGNVNVEGNISINGGAISQSSTLPLDDSDSIVLSNSNLNVIRNNRIVIGRAESYVRLTRDGGYNTRLLHTDKNDNMFVSLRSYDVFERNVAVYNMNGTLAFSLLTAPNRTYLMKVNPSGQIVWHILFIGSATLQSVTTDSDSNIFAMGMVSGSTTLYSASGTTGATTTCLTPFIAKWDASGIIQWRIEYAGVVTQYPDIASFLCTDSNNNIYALLNLKQSQTFKNANGTSSSVSVSSSTNEVPYIVKWSSNGVCASHISVESSDSRSMIEGRSMTVSKTDGAIYMAGVYKRYGTSTYYIYNASTSTQINSNKTLRYDPNPNTYAGTFVVKWSSAGVAVWSVSLLSDVTSFGQSVYPSKVLVDATGNTYVCGRSDYFQVYDANQQPTANFKIGTEYSNVPLFFVVKFNSAGTPIWCSNFRTGLKTFNNNVSIYCESSTIDAKGDIFFTGYYGDSPLSFYEGNTRITVISGASTASVGMLIKLSTSSGAVKWWTNILDAGGLGSDVEVDSRGYVHVLVDVGSAPYTRTVYNAFNVPSLVFNTSTSTTKILLRYTDEYIEPYKLVSNLPVSQNGLYKYILNTSTTTAAPLLLRNAADNATLSNMSIAPNQIIELIWQSPTWYLGQT